MSGNFNNTPIRANTAPAPQNTAALPHAHGNNPKVFIKSFGCQMNVYDSQRMADRLVGEGFAETAEAAEADLVILNTCHIREKADDKLFSELGRLRAIKEARLASGKESMLAVAGCVAQAQGAEIMARQNAVDLVFGPQAYQDLPQLLARAKAACGAGNALETRVVATDFATLEKFARLPAPSNNAIHARGISAYVTIQEGCDKFCTFCVVPYTRGAEYSRPMGEIVEEVTTLVTAGVREVTLLGQNVNAWNGRDTNGAASTLARLVEKLSGIADLKRIRYTTSHPLDMHEDLIFAHRDLPKLMPFLHLPVQSGSDRVLKAMNRRHSARDYRALVARLRAACPKIALSSDFIVGFPGETEEDFQDTLTLIADITFASAYYFKYSARPGTPAAQKALDIGLCEDVKSERLARLQMLVEAQRRAFNQNLVGQTVPVLVEKRGRHDGQLNGKTPWLQPVHFSGEAALIGQEVLVTLAEAHTNSFVGVVANPVLAASTPHGTALTAQRPLPAQSQRPLHA